MTAAYLAVALAVGGWAGIRWAEAGKTIDRTLAEVIMSIDINDAAEHAEAADR